MKKLILFLLILMATNAEAGGLFSGCMSSGFGTSVQYRTDTYAYQARVVADGGTVINIAMVDNAYKLLADNSLSPVVWLDANFGVKKDGSNKVSKLYDITDNDFDATQATSGAQPVWTTGIKNGLAGIVFDGTDDTLSEGSNLGKPASFTTFTICAADNVASNNFVWGNYVSPNSYTMWFAAIADTASGDLKAAISNQSGSANTGFYTAGSQITNGEVFLYTTKFATGAYTNLLIYKNTSVKSGTFSPSNATTNSGTSYNYSIGGYGNLGSNYFDGSICTHIVFNSALSDTNRGYIESFLNGAYEVY